MESIFKNCKIEKKNDTVALVSDVSEHAYAVIVAGGGGTRLWPKSRKKHPKHLLKLFGKETLLRTTFTRIQPMFPLERIIVFTLDEYVDEVRKQIPEIPRENILSEPMAKNTALAMTTVAAFLSKRDPKAVLINLSADQTVKQEDKFRDAIATALEVSESGDYITTIAIRPTFPHTGMGYIWIGEQFKEVEDKGAIVFVCRGFKEKPDLSTAQAFLATKQYFWNAGIYGWSISTLQAALNKHAPKLAEAFTTIQNAVGTSSEKSALEKVYDQAENVPIDIAVSEKAKNIIVVPGNFDWSDVGDWKAVYEMNNHDAIGNAVLQEEFIGLETKNCLIEGSGRMIVTIGVEDLMIIDTEDALLICRKDKTQSVKKVIEQLKEAGREDLL